MRHYQEDSVFWEVVIHQLLDVKLLYFKSFSIQKKLQEENLNVIYMHLNPKNIKMIEFFHRQDFQRDEIKEDTKKCLKEIYDVLKSTPRVSFSTAPPSETNVLVKLIAVKGEVPKGQGLNDSPYMSKRIAKYIHSHPCYYLKYHVLQNGRNIIIHFIVFEKVNRKKYDDYMQHILQVLFVLNHFSHKTCMKSREFNIYLYMTPFMKVLPCCNKTIGADNVNTGVNIKDRVCSSSHPEEMNEITIYREEDWFKVLIHESIHSFRLDFPHAAKEEIYTLFPVKSEVNLFEAYTEFWAEMLNMLFCAIAMERRSQFDKVIDIMNLMIQVEKRFSLFQAVKVLQHMGLRYEDIIRGVTGYAEESNVLAYFILKLCLMNHYNDFVGCCKTHCHNVLNFDEEKLHVLIGFIKNYYKDQTFLEEIRKMESIKKDGNAKMTLFELK